MSRHCQLTGKKANNSVTICFSHKRNKRLQHVNLQWKRIWWPEGNRFVTLHISTKAIKTLQKKSLSTFAKEAGIDLNKF
jgi:large subunit ribosomal protein L28